MPQVILAWAAKEDAATILGVGQDATHGVRKAAVPFVDWLQVGERGSTLGWKGVA